MKIKCLSVVLFVGREKVDMLFLILTDCCALRNSVRCELERRIQIGATAINRPSGCLEMKIRNNIFLSTRRWKVFMRAFSDVVTRQYGISNGSKLGKERPFRVIVREYVYIRYLKSTAGDEQKARH